MARIFKAAEDVLATEKDILAKTRDLSYAHHLRPELSILVSKQWEFVEKTFYNRFAKHGICRRTVSNHINSNTNLLLDSGSTLDLVTFELLTSSKENMNIASNNVFAAMHLIGERRISCRLLSGLFNDRYAATYSKEAFGQIQNQDFSIIILATTALSFESGTMVDHDDADTLNFKRAVLGNFGRSVNSKLIIAADASKFLGDREAHVAVLPAGEWAAVVAKQASRICLVTSSLRAEIDPMKRAEFDRQIELFQKARIMVDIQPERLVTETELQPWWHRPDAA